MGCRGIIKKNRNMTTKTIRKGPTFQKLRSVCINTYISTFVNIVTDKIIASPNVFNLFVLLSGPVAYKNQLLFVFET